MSSQTIELENKYEFIRLVLPFGFSPYVPEYDDGIDFILHRRKGNVHLNIQLKSRWAVEKKYFGRSIWIAFPVSDERSPRTWYLAPHDRMVALAQPHHSKTESWKKSGYSKPSLPDFWRSEYEKFKVESLLRNLTPEEAKSTNGFATSWEGA